MRESERERESERVRTIERERKSERERTTVLSRTIVLPLAGSLAGTLSRTHSLYVSSLDRGSHLFKAGEAECAGPAVRPHVPDLSRASI